MRRLSLLFPVLFSALWLSGCAFVETEPSLPASIEARVGVPAPVKHALDYKEVCLLPVKANDKDPLLAAIRRGAENAGAKVTTLAPDAGTRACPFVLMWEVNARGRRVEAVRFLPFEWGVPKGGAKITGTPEKGLTIDVVELNTASYFTYLQRKARETAEKTDQKNASFTKQ